jgi:tRNA(Ile)-lysidine synthase
VGHDILRWQGWDGAGNLLAAARAARFRLIGGWARGAGIGAVALGHTRDDVAETLLMRLARAAGVDGLAAMPARFSRDGVVWVRPLLGVGRAALRDHLVARGIGWVEDPSNADDRFARTRARAVLAALAPLGLDAAVLATVAGNLAGAAEALRAQAARDAPRLVRADRGDLLLERSPEPAVPDEIARRVLVGALRAVAGGAWPPRRAALAALEAGMAGPGRHTLAGCVVSRRGTLWRIAREWAAVQGVEGPTDAPWDGRWWLAGPHEPGLTVRALGPDGLAQCPGWRAGGLPRASLLASPAVWRGAVLVAAPLAGRPGGWRAECRARLFCD